MNQRRQQGKAQQKMSEVEVTPEEKDLLRDYAKAYGMLFSDFTYYFENGYCEILQQANDALVDCQYSKIRCVTYMMYDLTQDEEEQLAPEVVQKESLNYETEGFNEATYVAKDYNLTNECHLVLFGDVVESKIMLWCMTLNLEGISGGDYPVLVSAEGLHPLVEVFKYVFITVYIYGTWIWEAHQSLCLFKSFLISTTARTAWDHLQVDVIYVVTFFSFFTNMKLFRRHAGHHDRPPS